MAESKNPFDFVDSASYTKVDLMTDESAEKDYVPYLANRAFSYHSDSVLYANEMNLWGGLDKKLQYDYYRHSLRKRSRRSKWAKPDDLELVGLVSWRYELSHKKAREALMVMSDDEIEKIRQMKDQKNAE